MTERATWKGFLTVARLAIAIKAYPATTSADAISFNQLHAKCLSRITQKKHCDHCDRDVPSAEIVKGFEFERGRYVVVSGDELDAVAPPSTRTIDLVQFVAPASIEWMMIDRAYVLAPDGPDADRAYAVLHEAMRDKAGIGKLAIYGREYLVAVAPRAGVLMLYTLHHAAELRELEIVEELNAIVPIFRRDEMKLARQVVAALTRPLDLTDFVDAVQADVRRLIDAKIAGDEIVASPTVPPAVLELKAALEQSLAAVARRKRA